MLKSLNVLDNAVFVKHARARLRLAKMLPSFIIYLIVCALGLLGPLLVEYYQSKRRENWEVLPAAIAFGILSVVQWFALTLLGTARVATALGEERDSGILDFHRVTPTSGVYRMVGYLFGTPIREHLFVVVSLPLSLIAAFLAKLSLPRVLLGYGIFWLNCLFYHTLAIVIGLITKKTKSASGSAVGVVIGLPIVAGVLARIGLPFLMYLTATAAFYGLSPEAVISVQFFEWVDEDFFGLNVSFVLCTIVAHLIAVGFITIVAVRRLWRQESPLLSKPQAAGLLTVIAALMVGSYWQALRTPDLEPTVLVSFFGVLLGVVGVVAMLLVVVVTPSRLAFSRAAERAKKGKRHSVATFSDGASNLGTIFVFLIIILVAYVGSFMASDRKVNLTTFTGSGGLAATAAPFLIIAVAVLGWAFASEFFSLALRRHKGGYMVLLFFLVWILPVLVSALLVQIGLFSWYGGSYVAVVSPPAGFVAALAWLLGVSEPAVGALSSLTAISLVVNTGLLVLFGLRTLPLTRSQACRLPVCKDAVSKLGDCTL
jgi:hypothetical protein